MESEEVDDGKRHRSWTVADDGGGERANGAMRPRLRWKAGERPSDVQSYCATVIVGRLFPGVVPGGGSKTRACFLTGVVADGELCVREAFDGSRVLVEGSEAVAAGASPWQLMPVVRVASQRRSFLRVVAGDRMCPREVVTGCRSLDARSMLATVGRSCRRGETLVPQRPGRACIGRGGSARVSLWWCRSRSRRDRAEVPGGRSGPGAVVLEGVVPTVEESG